MQPHAVSDGLVGPIIDALSQQGFQVTAIQTFALTNSQASEFLEVYKGVVSEYPQMVAELVSGTSVALEVD